MTADVTWAKAHLHMFCLLLAVALRVLSRYVVDLEVISAVVGNYSGQGLLVEKDRCEQ